jgi:membrane protease YdiL (CAAX protease family)
MTTHTHKTAPPTATPAVEQVEQHSLVTSLTLHLVPGVLTATAFYALAPLLMRAGYPAIAAGALAAAVFVVGGELGWLLWEAHRRTGSWSIVRVLPYRPAPLTWRKGLLVVGLFGWALGVSVLGIGTSMRDSFFSWMPEWALNPISGSYSAPGNDTPGVITAVAFLLVLVILGPLVEELYFRGYLMPRMARFGAWAPLVNVSLFAAYHLWKPWDVINLILILAPMVYAVWRLKDIRVGIALHIALNTMAWGTAVAPVLLFD